MSNACQQFPLLHRVISIKGSVLVSRHQNLVGVFVFAVLLTLLFSILSAPMNSQVPGTDYLDCARDEQLAELDACFVRRMEVSIDQKLYEVTVMILPSGIVVMSGDYSDPELTIEEGYFYFYFANGSPESEGLYVNGVKSGGWKRWDWMGIPLPDRYYPLVPVRLQ